MTIMWHSWYHICHQYCHRCHNTVTDITYVTLVSNGVYWQKEWIKLTWWLEWTLCHYAAAESPRSTLITCKSTWYVLTPSLMAIAVSILSLYSWIPWFIYNTECLILNHKYKTISWFKSHISLGCQNMLLKSYHNTWSKHIMSMRCMMSAMSAETDLLVSIARGLVWRATQYSVKIGPIRLLVLLQQIIYTPGFVFWCGEVLIPQTIWELMTLCT